MKFSTENHEGEPTNTIESFFFFFFFFNKMKTNALSPFQTHNFNTVDRIEIIVDFMFNFVI